MILTLLDESPDDGAVTRRVGTVRPVHGQLRYPGSAASADSDAADTNAHGTGIAKTAEDRARASNGAAEEEP
jgi:hypothetical protein